MKNLLFRTNCSCRDLRVRKNLSRPLSPYTWVPIHLAIGVVNTEVPDLNSEGITFLREYCNRYGVTLDEKVLYDYLNEHKEDFRYRVQPALEVRVSRFGVDVMGVCYWDSKRCEISFKRVYERVDFDSEWEIARTIEPSMEAGLSYAQYMQMMFECRDVMRDMEVIGYTNGVIITHLPSMINPAREETPYCLTNVRGWEIPTVRTRDVFRRKSKRYKS